MFACAVAGLGCSRVSHIVHHRCAHAGDAARVLRRSMDRWADADDEITARPRARPQGKVAAEGLGGFVRSAETSKSSGGEFKIEVVASKKEQVKRAGDARAMPPPPPKLPVAAPPPQQPPPHTSSSEPPGNQLQPSSHPDAGQHGFKPPVWSSEPPQGACLEVFKGDTLVQEVPLDKVATVFGRHVSADVLCDHPSLSRHHAAICFQGMTGRCLVLDLGSTHGTFVDGKRVEQVPVELKAGGELRFAASTRRYILRYCRGPPIAHKRQLEQVQDASDAKRRQHPDGS